MKPWDWVFLSGCVCQVLGYTTKDVLVFIVGFILVLAMWIMKPYLVHKM